ncbi:hypothetical protein RKD23_004015 [Streptomyces sp. SAI-170]
MAGVPAAACAASVGVAVAHPLCGWAGAGPGGCPSSVRRSARLRGSNWVSAGRCGRTTPRPVPSPPFAADRRRRCVCLPAVRGRGYNAHRPWLPSAARGLDRIAHRSWSLTAVRGRPHCLRPVPFPPYAAGALPSIPSPSRRMRLAHCPPSRPPPAVCGWLRPPPVVVACGCTGLAVVPLGARGTARPAHDGPQSHTRGTAHDLRGAGNCATSPRRPAGAYGGRGAVEGGVRLCGRRLPRPGRPSGG